MAGTPQLGSKLDECAVPNIVKIMYVDADGVHGVFDSPVGLSLMEGAVRNGISGILGNCGGACACATCRVEVDLAWLSRSGPRSDIEEEMVSALSDTTDRTRLACQIVVVAELDGLAITIPGAQ
jgi:ferredoxin, 2Fe-2S